ncbi:hypothetical protein [Rhodococcus wratislaviensis]|nr:hypothetical protein [Rhodococcus wratislaviensis]
MTTLGRRPSRSNPEAADPCFFSATPLFASFVNQVFRGTVVRGRGELQMADIYYNEVMHPLVGGYFGSLAEVRETIEEFGGSLGEVTPEHPEWRLVEHTRRSLDGDREADRFHRLTYQDEQPTDVERWAFSFATEDVLFNGVLIRDPDTGDWDEESPLVMTNRIAQTFWTSPDLIDLAEKVVKNTRGSVNDRTEAIAQHRRDAQAAAVAKAEATEREAAVIAAAMAPRTRWQRFREALFGRD